MVFLPQEVIARKRDSKELSADEIADFIAGIDDGTVTHAQLAAFAMAVLFRGMTIAERVALVTAMLHSGNVLDWSGFDAPVVDKHSTGGVGDNVSLMLAPILAACGTYVPMISGRGLGHTGGTLDKFDAIPGYRTDPDNALFRRTVREAGCAIIGQTDDLAPADRTFYAVRDVTGTVESIPLITASILSKKLAAGLDALVLDVKCGSGAFMQTPEAARALADSLVTVANSAGLKAGALITDMNQPLASAAGNALEMRNAIEFLTGAHRDPRLLEVVIALCANTLSLSGVVPDSEAGARRARSALASGAAAERFGRMVSLLGGPADLLERAGKYLEPAPIVRDIHASEPGVVSAIDTRAVGMAVVALGGGRRQTSDRIDFAVGFDRLAPLGALAGPGSPIARIHARTEASAIEGERRLVEAYRTGQSGPADALIHYQAMPKSLSFPG